ncbi:MAG: lipopolysaccharide transport periplasmic protein LptA [Sulfurimonas sp.]|jgi:lipopolysaccharide export system protein LptA|nr:lipopolysaccharide transport periplasmic protein LptA [Sulfurimonadaceae bacterium]
MKILSLLFIFVATFLSAEELKIKALEYSGDQNKGISIFTGNVHMTKLEDELIADKVTVYTDKENNPTKFVAEGNVSFKMTSEDGARYKGVSQKAIYLPNEKEYHFYIKAHLIQLDDHKEIMGDEVVFKSIEGKAFAKGAKDEPVIMIFDIKDDKKKKSTPKGDE